MGPMPLDQDSGAFRAQDLRSLSAKVMRIDPETGLGYPSNPFYDGDPASNASKIWALGLRNPYRLNLKPGTGATDPALGQPNTMYIGDVGSAFFEEINVSKVGGENFGWPCWEGPAAAAWYPNHTSSGPPFNYPDCNGPNPGVLTGPMLAWNRDDPGIMVPNGVHFAADDTPLNGFTGSCAIGGTHYVGGSYPPEYAGRFFFADYSYEWVKTIETDAQDNIVAVRDFGTGFERIVDMQRHPISGDIYFLLHVNPGPRVFHLRYDDNLTPTAVAQAAPTVGNSPLAVQFDASNSSDPENAPLDFLWDFGDGTPLSTEENPMHVYNVDGVYQAQLTVSDPGMASSVDEVTIAVGESPPVATVLAPTSGTLFQVGDTIQLQGAGQDFQDPVLSYDWNVSLHHNDHVHSLYFVSDQQNDQFTAEDHGDFGDLFYYHAALTVTDSSQLQHTDDAYIYPFDRPRDVTGTAIPISHLDALDPPNPTGGGNQDIEVIRDNDFPPLGTLDVEKQFDTRHETHPTEDNWVGFELADPPTSEMRFISMTFQEGIHLFTGGWFDDISVDVRSGGVWEPVTGLAITPDYPFEDVDEPFFNGVEFETYELTFHPKHGDAIRMRGAPGGIDPFISVAELRFEMISILPPTGPLIDVTAEGEIIARLFELDPPVPQGRGNLDPETIRNGTLPAVSSPSEFAQFDTFHFGDQGDEDWIGYRFDAPRRIAQVVYQEGVHRPQGGRFDTLDVQVQLGPGGAWTPVTGLSITPVYPGMPAHTFSYEAFTLDFDPVLAYGVRLFGDPSGSVGYISVGELRVLAEPVEGTHTAYCGCANGPCGNHDPDAGCANSTGSGARLDVAAGSTSVASDDLLLAVTGAPPNVFGIVFKGRTQIMPFFNDGLRCAGAVAGRYAPSQADAFGTILEGPGLAARFAQHPNSAFHILPGSTWNFQTWYRDPSGPCGSGSNLTNGLSVVFTP